MRTTGALLLTGILWLVASAPFAAADDASPISVWPVTGKVAETMDTSRYTYIKVDTGKQEIWAAGPTTPVKVGESIHLMSGFPMKGFRSNTLDRTFEMLYLVSAIHVIH